MRRGDNAARDKATWAEVWQRRSCRRIQAILSSEEPMANIFTGSGIPMLGIKESLGQRDIQAEIQTG